MKQGFINVDGRTFIYNDEIDDISYETNTPISKEDATAILKKIKTLFEAKGINYCLGFGTLLGAVRDKSIIKGDEDVDIIVESEDEIRRNLFFFAENGLYLCRYSSRYLYSFRINNRSYVDVYFQYKLPFSVWKIWCIGLIQRTIPRNLLKKYDSISFLGDTYPIPHNPERILEFWYGKGWKEPVSGHDFTYDTPSHYWWKTKGQFQFEKIKYYIKLPIKFLICWKYWKKIIKD